MDGMKKIAKTRTLIYRELDGFNYLHSVVRILYPPPVSAAIAGCLITYIVLLESL